jgi:hydroxybutyrate-dimer hydrolase
MNARHPASDAAARPLPPAPPWPRSAVATLLPWLALLASGAAVAASAAAPSGVTTISQITYDGVADDLLTGGLGRTGLAGPAPAVTDPTDPAQLRRLAIHTNYRAILDITAGGGYGRLYGPNIDLDGQDTLGEGRIAGTETLGVADRGGRGRNVTVMVQVPASFDPARPCIVTGTSSGSRGIYGAIGSSGEWGLKRGCAVAYSDKGTGNGMHDLQANTVNRLDGVRADADVAGADSVFTAAITDEQRAQFNAATPDRLAVKHAHSQFNPEQDWGRDTLTAVRYALQVLNESLPARSGDGARRFTPANTLVIASSVSNGAGAALLAAEQDRFGLIDGVAVTEPNIQVQKRRPVTIRRGDRVYTGGSKPLYDYFSFAGLYQPCAALAPAAAAGPFAFAVNAALAANRCASLAEKGLLKGETTAAQAEEALEMLLAYGWEPETVPLHASHYAFATPAITMTYSNAHGRFSVLDNLCGLSFAYTGPTGAVIPALPGLATIFGTGNGVPPTGGINIVNNLSLGGPLLESISVSPSTGRADYHVDGALCQRRLWDGDGPDADRVRQGVRAVQASGRLRGTPTLIVHGRADTLVPVNFSSRSYVATQRRLEGESSPLSYIEVTNAQHFDAFLPLAGFDAAYVPLHVYLNRALDAMWAHLTEGTPLPPSQLVRTTPRGAGAPPPPLQAGHVPPILAVPAAADRIVFDGDTMVIPD